MTTPRPADSESGFILINVLAVVAIASAVVVTMLTIGQIGIRRSQRFGDAAQASAWAAGAETSAIVALRRDGEEAPQIDHMGEAWAAIGQERIAIEQGVFDVRIEDAQSKFNVNGLLTAGMAGLGTFRKIVVALGLAPELADDTLALIRFVGPVADIRDLAAAGFDDAGLAALDTMVTALPGRADVNLNTAGEGLIGTIIGNPVTARFLVSRRERTGFLSQDDLSATNIIAPPGAGFTSNYFWLFASVTVGDTQQTIRSLLERRKRDGRVEVVAVSHKRGGAARLP